MRYNIIPLDNEVYKYSLLTLYKINIHKKGEKIYETR